MERTRHDDPISKRRRLDFPTTAGDISSDGDSKIAQFRDDVVYRLYFKGLVNHQMMSAKSSERIVKGGFGVAICDEEDKLLREIKQPINDAAEMSRKRLELMALICGLSESLDLGIRNVEIYCEDYQIYQFIIGRGQREEIITLVNEVIRLREKMVSSEIVLAARNDVKFAFRLAREAIDSQISSSVGLKAKKEETCVICLEETKADQMFFTNRCLHRYCFSCVKQFVEVKLLSGVVPKCLDYECKVELTLESCSKVLTSKLIEMWEEKMKEDSIPASERIYCPYPSCAVLMSKTELWRFGDQSNVRSCVKCCGLFCIDCKVPSHTGLSCADYKRLHSDDLVDDMKLKSLANENKWRQCIKCRHLIELSDGCNHMTCRCKYEFCYKCGTEWDKNQQTCPSGCLHIGHDDYEDDDTEEDESEFEDEDEDAIDDAEEGESEFENEDEDAIDDVEEDEFEDEDEDAMDDAEEDESKFEDEDEDDDDDEEDDYDDHDEEHECEKGRCGCYYDEDGLRWRDQDECLEYKEG